MKLYAVELHSFGGISFGPILFRKRENAEQYLAEVLETWRDRECMPYVETYDTKD